MLVHLQSLDLGKFYIYLILPAHHASIHPLLPLRPLASGQGVFAFFEAQSLALDPFGLSGPPVVILGLHARTGQTGEPDVVIGISAAQFQRTDMLVNKFTGL